MPSEWLRNILKEGFVRAFPATCLALAMMLPLVGCNEAQQSKTGFEETNKAPLGEGPSTAASEGVLVEAGLDIVPIVSSADDAWAGKPVIDKSRYDRDIDVTRRSVIFPAGLVVVDRGSDGGVVYVRLQSGVGQRCGEAGSLGAAYEKLAQHISVPTLTQRDVDQLKLAWTSNREPVSISNSGVTIRAAGGCLPWLSVKAG